MAEDIHTVKPNCTIYIDEAGDLGVGRGTDWFILSGIIVNNEDEPGLRKILQSIKSKLNLQNIHFRQLRDFAQRCYVVNELCNGEFTIVNVVVDTRKLTLKPKNPQEKLSMIAYNYACRYLLERISWLLRDTNRVGKVVLSSRGTSRDKELIDYIKEKLLNYDYNQISNQFSSIESKTATSWDMLQLADVCATSLFYQYEPNQYGMIIPCYSLRLSQHLYKRNNTVAGYGIKYFADDMRPDAEYFASKVICKIKNSPKQDA